MLENESQILLWFQVDCAEPEAMYPQKTVEVYNQSLPSAKLLGRKGQKSCLEMVPSIMLINALLPV